MNVKVLTKRLTVKLTLLFALQCRDNILRKFNRADVVIFERGEIPVAGLTGNDVLVLPLNLPTDK